MVNLRFSVVTVVLNGGTAMGKTVESVLGQTYPPYEYIVVDGGSSDCTLAVAKAYEAAFARRGIRYRIFSEPDTGLYNAMNKGIRLAQGDFISFLNVGDWYEPDGLENICGFYETDPFELTYGGLNYWTRDGRMVRKMSKLDRFPVTSRHWNHPSMFLRREIYEKYGFDETFRFYGDFDLYLKLRRDGTKIRVIHQVITNFVADGISTDTRISRVLSRAGEKYRAYRHNGYSPVYCLEAYGWELVKMIYFKLRV